MFLNKFLPYFFFPVTWALLFMLAALFTSWRQKQKWSMALTLLACLTLWLFSTTRVGQWLVECVENQFPPIPVEELPQADAIVLLGGGIMHPFGLRTGPELNDGGDRVFQAAELYHAGKAPYILVSGGQVFPQAGLQSEADYHVGYLIRLGVPREAIILESESRNTAENARNSLPILKERGARHVLLVTSAFHMPRSVLLFEGHGVKITPVSTDLRAPRGERPEILYWLPDADSLSLSQLAIRETMGYWFYRLTQRDAAGAEE